MRARFLGKDPASVSAQESPTMFATDRAEESTFVVQGWRVSDPSALSLIGDVPTDEVLIEVPEEVMEMYARRYDHM